VENLQQQQYQVLYIITKTPNLSLTRALNMCMAWGQDMQGESEIDEPYSSLFGREI
jgi:hypothetical protein